MAVPKRHVRNVFKALRYIECVLNTALEEGDIGHFTPEEIACICRLSNTTKAIEQIVCAHHAGADLWIFPEL